MLFCSLEFQCLYTVRAWKCFFEKSDTTIKWHELACNLRGKPLVNHEISYQHCAIAVFVGDQTRKTVQRHFLPYTIVRFAQQTESVNYTLIKPFLAILKF